MSFKWCLIPLISASLFGCAVSPSPTRSLSIQKYQAMEACVDGRTNEKIKLGELQSGTYSEILKSCSSEYGSLAVARYADGLPPIPYEFWQLKIIKKIQEAAQQTTSSSAKTASQKSAEAKFMTAYYALQGRLVIVGTAFEKCPSDLTSDGRSTVHRNTLSQSRAIFLAADNFVFLWDRDLKGQLKAAMDEYKRTAAAEFVKIVDSLFVSEKLDQTCAKAMDLGLTDEALVDFIESLADLDKQNLSADVRSSVQEIKAKIVSTLGTLRKV